MSITLTAEAKRRFTATLNRLIETCKDGEKGYRDAASDLRESPLKSLFDEYSCQRGRFVSALQQAIAEVGGFAANSGTVDGALRRGWLDLKSALEGGDARVLLVECERNEDVAEAKYATALRQTLPDPVRTLLECQYAAIKDAHRELQRLRGSS
jgi:uncharacterized protein (TIGR02284 family)